MDRLSVRRATKKSAANFVAAAAALSLSALLTAGEPPAFAVTPGDIVLGDITVMRIRTASGGVSAEDRASMVQNRINEILAIPNLTAKDVTIVTNKYGPTLYVHKVKLITVDLDTAKDQGLTPDALAKTWAHRLMGVIAQVNIRLPGGPAPATPAANPVVAGSPSAPVTPLENVPPPAKTPDEKSSPPATPNAPVTPPNAPATQPANPPAADPAAPAPAAPASPAPASPGTSGASGETSSPFAAS